jgi:hypothetical protein
LKRLERSEAKVSRYVLMGRDLSNGILLPTKYKRSVATYKNIRIKL